MAATRLAEEIPVIDFRRQRLTLEWRPSSGTWTACDVPPSLVHGVALIRASQPNICLYGAAGRLHLQVGTECFVLGADAPRVQYNRSVLSLGLRQHFTVESAGATLLRHTYWTGQGDDFFRWLVDRTANAAWRAEAGPRWSQGVDAATLRAA